MRLIRKILCLALVVTFATIVSAHPIIDMRHESDATYSVLLEGSRIARLATWGGLAAKVRAEIVACRLENFIEAGDPASVRVEMQGDLPVIRTNLGILVTVDDLSARAEGAGDSQALALEWAAHLVRVLETRVGMKASYERVVDYTRPAPGKTEVAEAPVVKIPKAVAAGPPATKPNAKVESGQVIEGVASWYGPGFNGRRTASGEIFDQNALTAAHKTLPFGTKLLVKDSVTGKSVVVVINDRGPFVGNRILDLSAKAAEQLDMVTRGISRVVAQVLPSH